VRLDARKNGQIAGSDVVRDRWNAGSTAQPTYGLPGNPAVCYRPTRSRVHLGNVGYIEPHWVSARLFEAEPFRGAIWDPACGMGRIVESAELAGLTTFGTDLVDRGGSARCHAVQHDGTRTYDFLAPRPDHDCIRADNVVTNPPFALAQAFAERAVELVSHKVAVLFPTARLNAARWLQHLPLAHVWLLSPRPSMPPGEAIQRGDKPVGGKTDFCWLILSRAHTESPGLRWLHRDEHRMRPGMYGDIEMSAAHTLLRVGIPGRCRQVRVVERLGEQFQVAGLSQQFSPEVMPEVVESEIGDARLLLHTLPAPGCAIVSAKALSAFAFPRRFCHPMLADRRASTC